MHKSGNFRTLRELASARNLHVSTNFNDKNSPVDSDGLTWFEKNIEHNPNENILTLDSSKTNLKVGDNMYKKSDK